GAPGDIKLPIGISLAPTVTDKITLTGNFAYQAVNGSTKEIPVNVYNKQGAAVPIVLNFQKTGAQEWTVGVKNDATVATVAISFAPDNKAKGDVDPITGLDTGKITLNGTDADGNPYSYELDVHDLTNYSGNTEARVSNTNGSGAGILSSYTVSNTGQT